MVHFDRSLKDLIQLNRNIIDSALIKSVDNISGVITTKTSVTAIASTTTPLDFKVVDLCGNTATITISISVTGNVRDALVDIGVG